jgi:hypothetical protein
MYTESPVSSARSTLGGQPFCGHQKEHQRHIRLEHLYKSAVAEHRVDSGHCIQFHDTSILQLTPDTRIRGSLSSAPSRNLHNMTTDTCYATMPLEAPAARLLCLAAGNSFLNPYRSYPPYLPNCPSRTDCCFHLPTAHLSLPGFSFSTLSVPWSVVSL